MAIPSPQYAITDGYVLNGMYPGFVTVGQGPAPQTWKSAITSLESHLGWSMEVISTGLPNQINDPTSTLQGWATSPQHLVWAAPLVPFNGGTVGTITNLLNGAYNTQIDATAAAFKAQRGWVDTLGKFGTPGLKYGGLNAATGLASDTLRVAWEYNLSNYPWGVNYKNGGQTFTQIAAGIDYYIGRMVAGGYRGGFDLNGGYSQQDGQPAWNRVYPLLTNKRYVTVLGHDFYNSSNSPTTYQQSMTTVWNNYSLSLLNQQAAYARANGMKMGFGECGTISNGNAPYNTRDVNNFWTLFHAWLVANADVVAYVCMYNEDGYDFVTTPNPPLNCTENDALFYWGSPLLGSAATDYTHLGNLTNSSATGPVVDTPSPIRALSLVDYKANMVTGSMQVTPPPITPTLGSYKVVKQKPRVVGAYFG